MNGSQTKQAPLAWSQTGDAIELPESAALWRVRRLSGSAKGGAPELVYGDDGLPLVVDVAIDPGEFAGLVDRRPGKYRLDALDEQRKAVQGVQPAYFVLGGVEGPRGEAALAGPESALKTLAEVFIKQSAHMNALIDACTRLVGAVDSAGVSKRPPPAPELPAPRNGVQEDEDDDQDAEEPREPDWLDRAADFCSKVPAENLRVLGEVAPDMVAKGIRQVMSDGLAGFVADKIGGRS